MPRLSRNRGLAAGYRSGLEKSVAAEIEAATGSPAKYESFKIEYVRPQSSHTYKPDFKLPNGIVIETKGQFTLEDRKKHILVKEQHPNMDLRFVFTRPQAPIRKGSTTTYADWCNANGFKYAHKSIPAEWYRERARPAQC